jgi:hypothetical protein
MLTEHTTVATGSTTSVGVHPLTPIVPLARAAPPAPAGPDKASFALPVTGGAADERALSVRYELDAVTHRWVASIVDDDSGEVVRTVPSKQVLHQLAALRRPSLDLHA